MKPKPIPRMTKDQIERFWAKVDIGGQDDCWEWRAGTTGRWEYGWLSLNNQSYFAHRVAFV